MALLNQPTIFFIKFTKNAIPRFIHETIELFNSQFFPPIKTRTGFRHEITQSAKIFFIIPKTQKIFRHETIELTSFLPPIISQYKPDSDNIYENTQLTIFPDTETQIRNMYEISHLTACFFLYQNTNQIQTWNNSTNQFFLPMTLSEPKPDVDIKKL